MIRLAKLPDRTPVKITIVVPPDLHQGLLQYADLYRQTYGDAEPIAELIPHMLRGFLATDRAFTKGTAR